MTRSTPSTLKRFFVSRSTMLTLLVALLCSVLLASLVPQSFLTPEPDLLRWRDEYGLLAPLAAVAGLHHVFTTPWFACILAASLLSMVLSAYDQGAGAWRKTFSPATFVAGNALTVANEEDVAAAAMMSGYLRMPVGEGRRYVRHPWGYWGNFLLHLGLVVTLGASLLIALTQQRGSLSLVRGEPHFSDDAWGVAENGILAGDFKLPFAVELVRLTPQFLTSGKVTQISSELKFTDVSGATSVQSVSVNAMLSHAGVHVYQSTDFGHAFRVDFTDPQGEVHHFTLPIYHPQSLEKEGYRDLRLPISGARLEVKYLADEKRRSLTRGTPVLTLRLMDNERETGRAVLRLGDSGRLGPFTVRLTEVTSWTDIIFVRIIGMPGVFAGFALIILGTICTYCLPPREFRLVESGDGYLVSWRAERFADFYADERDDVLSRVAHRES